MGTCLFKQSFASPSYVHVYMLVVILYSWEIVLTQEQTLAC